MFACCGVGTLARGFVCSSSYLAFSSCYCWHRDIAPHKWIAFIWHCVARPAYCPQFRLGCVPGTPIRCYGYGASHCLSQECCVCPTGPRPGMAVKPNSFDIIIWDIVTTVSNIANEVVMLVPVAPPPPPPVLSCPVWVCAQTPWCAPAYCAGAAAAGRAAWRRRVP